MKVQYPYHSLEDFLVSSNLTVDGQLDDGWGATFPVKGREIHATILFADITNFTGRTIGLTSTETLIFVNNFFAWISAEALRSGNGIIDKYVGDELMIVFSKEFGSEDPLVEALQTARWMCEHDALSFMPHIGIASGPVTVGYVGTPVKYNCSVFGAPVALATRCASIKPWWIEDRGIFSSYIVLPSEEWAVYDFDKVFPPRRITNRIDGSREIQTWEMLEPSEQELKNIGEVELRSIVKLTLHEPSISAVERAKDSLRTLREIGRYWPEESIGN